MNRTTFLSLLLLAACGGAPDDALVESSAPSHARAPTRLPPPVPCGPNTCEGGGSCCDASCGLCAPAGVACSDLDAVCAPSGPAECDPARCPPLASDAGWTCDDGTEGGYTGRCVEDLEDPRVPAFPVCAWETFGCAR